MGAAALRSGEIQLTNKVALEYYQKTMQEAPERIWGLPLLGTYLYTFNLNLPELQDVRVRQALSMAIDRYLLTEKVSGQGRTSCLVIAARHARL